MNEIGSKTLNSSKAAAEPDRREGGLAAISVIGAFLASACCIVPLLLVFTVGAKQLIAGISEGAVKS